MQRCGAQDAPVPGRQAFDRSQSAPRGGSVGMVLLVALLLVAAAAGLVYVGARPCRKPISWRCWPCSAPSACSRCSRLPPASCACRPRRGNPMLKARRRQRLRRHCGHRPGGPRVLRQCHLSRPDRRGRRQRRAPDRAGVHRRSRRLRSDLPAAQSRARRPRLQEEVRLAGSAPSRRAGCACACVRSARPSATRN